MAISYPVSIPSVGGVRSADFSMLDAVGKGESPYTFSQELYEHPGKRWAVDIQLAPMVRAYAEEWIAFLASLRGQYGTFLFGDPVGATARGSAGGSPLVDGGGQSGQTLRIRGAPHVTASWLLKGDWVQLGTGSTSQLHKCLTDVTTDSGGQANLELWPGPRVGAAWADGSALTLASTKGLWRLASNERRWNVAEAQIFGLNFSAIEAQ